MKKRQAKDQISNGPAKQARKRIEDGAVTAKSNQRSTAKQARKHVELEENKTTKFSRASGNSSNSSKSQNEADIGIIESVSVKNFMCHTKLHFQFGPNVNFIIGRNGSGKSAILTAVIVGLGGKALVTNRGSSIRVFVKSGKKQAIVTVQLRNRGDEAYKPNEYGESIFVERRLGVDGTSSYKLKAEDGRVVSTKREELLHILDQFNIQVDNPVSVLNQETSRNFLQSKSPKDKYAFFLKATQLGQMKEDYSMADEQKKIAEAVLADKEAVMPELQKEVKVLERNWRLHQSLDGQRDKLQRLRKELSWSIVEEEEAEVRAKLGQLNKETKLTPKCKEKVAECQEKVAKAIQGRQEMQNKLRAINEEFKKNHPRHLEVKHGVGNAKEAFRAKQRELRKIENEISCSKKEVEGLKKRVDELRSVDLQSNASEKEKRLEKIAFLEGEQGKLLAQRNSQLVHLNQLKGSVAKLEEELLTASQKERNGNMIVQNILQNISDLEESRSNQLRMFGRHIPQLLEEIDRATRHHKFKERPRGPIGACIKLHDPQWALAIEQALRVLPFSFCCDNHQDERVLRGLMQTIIRDGRKPPIIVSQFQQQVYDVRKYAVQSARYPSLFQMLVVEDPVVLNCLIDQRGIEMILLIQNNSEARQVMLNDVPRNCSEVFTLEGDQIYPSPNFRYYSCRKNKAEYLQGSVEDQIRNKKIEMEKMKADHVRLRTGVQEVREHLKGNKAQLHDLDMHCSQTSRALNRISLEMNELKNVDDPVPVDVTALEDEIKEVTSQLASLANKQEEAKRECTSARTQVEVAESEYRECEETMKRLLNDSEPCKEELTQIDNEIEQLKVNRNHYEDYLKKHLRNVAVIETEYEKMEAKCKANLAKVEKVCDRITSDRQPHMIENEIIQIEKQLSEDGNRQEDRDEITRQYHSARHKYEKIKFEVAEMKKFMQALSSVLGRRVFQYRNFRQQVSVRIKYIFVSALMQRQYHGKLSFDHKNESLAIMVQPNASVRELNNDVKALSGGERSFATVSFVLALWDAVDSPVHILDEFDVFMDMVNRRISMDMMMDTACHKTMHQFIFLSPLDWPNIKASKFVRICRMQDPERGQGARRSHVIAGSEEDDDNE